MTGPQSVVLVIRLGDTDVHFGNYFSCAANKRGRENRPMESEDRAPRGELMGGLSSSSTITNLTLNGCEDVFGIKLR